jgi:predicted secreted hydrolase
MAHFALADERGGRFRHAERFARAALGLAGAQGAPFRVWLEDWSATAEPDAGPEGIPPLRLRAREEGFALDLRLEPGKPPVLQGDRGLSQKGPEPGNASHYYSLTRMPATGTLSLDGREVAVRGSAWMDREWSTSALGEGVAGWDWFALQLDDGRDLMLYRLRREDGSADPWSKGSLVEADGRARTLAVSEFVLAPLATWTSPATGAAYPVRWRIAVPSEGLELEVAPRLEAQEMQVAVRYWEGAVTVRGAGPSGPVAGHGFLEMTGYAPSAPGDERRAGAAASRTGG